MFKLSLAFSAISLAVGQAPTVDVYCQALEAQCFSVFNLNATTCRDAMASIDPGVINQTNANTIGCRWKYLDNVDMKDCRFAGPSGGGRCGDVLSNVCEIATGICSQTGNTSYTTKDLCIAGLKGLEHHWGSRQGQSASTDNSLECRVYHALAGWPDNGGTWDFHCGHFNATSSQCKNPVPTNRAHYCDTLQYNCQGSDAQFNSLAECLAVAPAFNDGSASNTSTNTLGCREYHAQAARNDTTHCQHAGPSGGNACGSPADAWATMLKAAPCSENSVFAWVNDTAPAVVDAMVPSGLSSSVRYSINFTEGNTQACRIYHLGAASINPTLHCHHGYVSGSGQCGTMADMHKTLCTAIFGACGFGTATWQFTDRNACETALANNITQGTVKPVQDVSGNTYECRFYHATVAAKYVTGGKLAGEADATTQRQSHCGHTLKPAPMNGCGYVAPSPTPGSNSATAVSLCSALFVVVFSVFSV